MSRRTERVGSLIRSVVSEAIQSRLSDPRIERFTSVTRVDVSEDLSLARVYVSVMANDAKRQLCLQALRSSAGRLRALLAQQMRIRQLPQLAFVLDTSLQRAFKTVQAIDAAMEELGEPSDRPGGDEGPTSAPVTPDHGREPDIEEDG